MKRSTEQILTTHTGSLPRPSDLVEMVLCKEEKQPVDEDAFATRVRSAVAEVVRRQFEIGVTVLNDGEQGKPDKPHGRNPPRRVAGAESTWIVATPQVHR